MKKIPTLYERVFENHRVVAVIPKVIEGMEWVLEGEGTATVKWDGSCCAINNGEFYKRYDAKKGKTPPAGAIPCCDPDPVTGHWPHWVKCDRANPQDRWFFDALDRCTGYGEYPIKDGTYEAIGKHFNNNPYKLQNDNLVKHGDNTVEVERTFDKIKKFLQENPIEGIVFWKDGEPQCKIKRSDFGFEWPVK